MEPARVEISSVCEETVSQNQPFQHLSQQQKSRTLRYGHTQKLAGTLEGSVAVQIKDQLRRWDELRGGAMLSILLSIRETLLVAQRTI